METKHNNVSAFNSGYGFKPIIIYNNFLSNKSNIKKENRNKIGIYRLVNKINNESYIGCSLDLTRRFGEYYNVKPWNNNNRISRALLFYGHDNFDIEILEYCNEESITEQEQYYFDLMKPEYNTQMRASLCHYPDTRQLLQI